MLRAVSTMPLPETAAGETANWPAPAPDELRLPILFSDGRASLGPIPLGPAPQLRALPWAERKRGKDGTASPARTGDL